MTAVVFAQPAGLTDAEVEAAIAAARQSGYKSIFAQARGRFAAGFTIIVQGPVGRTMDLAREAHDSYKPITPKDVPAEIRARAVTFTVLKHGPTAIKNVVVMPAGAASRDAAIQPMAAASNDARPRTWKRNFVGSEESGTPSYYRFAEASLPTGEFQIVVATDGGDERYTIRAQERSSIR